MRFFQASVLNRFFDGRALVLILCVAMFSNLAAAQLAESSADSKDFSPEGVTSTNRITFDNQTITCANLNAKPDSQYGGAFTKIVDNDQLRLNFNSPNGNFQYKTYNSSQGPVSLTGSQPSPIKNIGLTSSSSRLSFNSQVPVLAVIALVGDTSYVYSYAYPGSPITYSDSNLYTRGEACGINRVTVCYGLALAPSAGSATISGRVLDSMGRGVRGSTVSVMATSSGSTLTARTNAFGYYSFEPLTVGEVYIISISDKRFTFSNDIRSISLDDDLSGVDFIANAE